MNFIIRMIITIVLGIIAGLLYAFAGFEVTTITILIAIYAEVLLGSDKEC